MKNQVLFKLINLVLFGVVIFFVTKYFVDNFSSFKGYNISSINLFALLVSLPFLWLKLGITSLSYHLVMAKIAPNIKLIENVEIWSKSYLGLYIPGKIGVLALRIIYYQKRGVSSLRVSYGFFIEIILSLISSCFLVLSSSLFMKMTVITNYLPWIVCLFIVLLISVHPRLIQFYARLYFKYLKRSDNYHIAPYSYLFYIKLVILHLVKWFFVGIGIFILINSITELSWSYLPFITGLYAAATILGIIAFFSPSGLGVVEGVMIVGLKSLLSNALAGLISILLRIWKICGELSFILLVRGCLWLFSNSHILKFNTRKDTLN